MRRPEELLEKAIGLGHGGDPGEAQLLGQALLQGPEHALRAAPGLRRIDRDQLDAELRQGPADLGRVVLVHTAACLGRVPVVRGPIGVERAEQPVFGDHLAEPAERAHRALLGNEEARIDLRCRIVHGHDQVPPLARNPLVARAVLVQHHPHHRSARPQRDRVRKIERRIDDLDGSIEDCATEIDRDRAISQRQDLLDEKAQVEALGGRSFSTKEQHQQEFAAATAEKFGRSKQSINQSIRRATHIDPSVMETVKAMPAANKGVELDALASINRTYQREAVNMVERGDAKDFRQAKKFWSSGRLPREGNFDSVAPAARSFASRAFSLSFPASDTSRAWRSR